jgi:hypothetical protein
LGSLVRKRHRVRTERRQRRGLRTHRQRGSACGKSNGYFEEVAAFHCISPSLWLSSMKESFAEWT